MTIPNVVQSIETPVSPERAFRIFTAELGRWWPLPFTFAGADFADAKVDPRAGGRWFETDRAGHETAWGEVLAWSPPSRLVLTFAIGVDRKPEAPGHASEVEIRFDASTAGTRVTVEHRAFQRHGAGGEALRAGMASPQGWPVILAEYLREVRQRG